jgi:hypothetical protein
MASAIFPLMFVGLLPFLALPAILAFASKHAARWVILGFNVVIGLVAVVLASLASALTAVIALLLWLGLFVWAIRGVGAKAKADVTAGPD